MKHSRLAFGLALVMALAIAAPAAAVWAGRNTRMHTTNYVYGYCPGSFSTWRGPYGSAMVLNNECTDPNVSADATITVNPACSFDSMNLSCYFSKGGLTALGFDHKLGTYCQGGSPGWDVESPDGSIWRFACQGGTHVPLVLRPGWERITFSAADAQQLAGSTTFVFDGTIKPYFMQVLQDEAGCTILDNLRINGVVIKRGPAGSRAACPINT